jgi:uncharacterized cupin superfamily protein
VTVPEAEFRNTKYGPVPDGDGWFVLNARDTRWREFGPLGRECDFQGKRPFKQIGVSVNVLEPGEFMAMYHSENKQEGFLVLIGECILIVEGEERLLKAWDFFHCPGGTGHTIIGAGNRPAVVVAVGARGGRKGVVYQVAAAARKHGAGVKQETPKAAEAYAQFPKPSRSLYREGWLPDL